MSIERPFRAVMTELDAVRPTVDQYIQAHGMPAHYADMLAFASTIRRVTVPVFDSGARPNADTRTSGMVRVLGASVPECNGSHDDGEIAAGAAECTACSWESVAADEAGQNAGESNLAPSVRRRVVPDEVRAAVERMCEPLDESVLSGATAKADAHCMALIRAYVLGEDSVSETPQAPNDDAAARDFVARHAGQLVRLLGIEDWHDIEDRDLKVEVALNRMFRGAPIESDPKYVIRMAAISSAACGYWTTSDPIRPEHTSLALQDVASLYRKYTRQLVIGRDLRSEIETLKQAAAQPTSCRTLLTDEQREAVESAVRIMTDAGFAQTVAGLQSLLRETGSGQG